MEDNVTVFTNTELGDKVAESALKLTGNKDVFIETLKKKIVDSIDVMRKDIEEIIITSGNTPYYLQALKKKVLLHVHSPNISSNVSNMCSLFSDSLFMGESLSGIKDMTMVPLVTSMYLPTTTSQLTMSSHVNLFIYDKACGLQLPIMSSSDFIIGNFDDDTLKFIKSFDKDISSRVFIVEDGANLDKVTYDVLSDIMVGLDIPDIEFPDSRKPVIKSLGKFIDFNINRFKEMDKLVEKVIKDKSILGNESTMKLIVDLMSIMLSSEQCMIVGRNIEYDIFKPRYRFKAHTRKNYLESICRVVESLICKKPDTYVDKDGNEYIVLLYEFAIFNANTSTDLTPILYHLVRIFYGVKNVILIDICGDRNILSMTCNSLIDNELNTMRCVESGSLEFINSIVNILCIKDLRKCSNRYRISDVVCGEGEMSLWSYLKSFYSFIDSELDEEDSYNFYY